MFGLPVLDRPYWLWTLLRHPYQIRGDDDLWFQGAMVLRVLDVITNHAGLGPHEFGAAFAALTIDDDIARAARALTGEAGQERGERLL